MPQPRAKHQDAEPEDVRLRISLRLKAARHLAGGLRVNAKGGYEAGAVTVEELAHRPLLVENQITKNRLDGYEQMKVTPRRMELEVIADALEVDRGFLLAPLGQAASRTVEQQLQTVADTLTVIKDQLPRVGRDIGRRDRAMLAAQGRLRQDAQDAV